MTGYRCWSCHARHQRTGRRHSAETRAKISENTKLAMALPWVKERHARSLTGKKHSEAHKARISAAMVQKWADPEYRAKVTAGVTASWRRRRTREVGP